MTVLEASIVVPVRLDQSPPPHGEVREDIAGSSHVETSIVTSLTPDQVVVVGYWPVPDQSAPRQLRDQFGDEAQASLDAVLESLDAGAFEVTSELVFTRDRDQLIDRVANKYGSTAVLVPGVVRSDPPERVLVLLKSDSDIDRIATTVGTLFEDSDVDILLFHAVEGGADADATANMLHDVTDQLTDRGIDSDRIRTQQSDQGSRVETIVSEVSDHDLVVLGESEPSVRDRLFGPVQSGITDRTDRPSLTIRASP